MRLESGNNYTISKLFCGDNDKIIILIYSEIIVGGTLTTILLKDSWKICWK